MRSENNTVHEEYNVLEERYVNKVIQKVYQEEAGALHEGRVYEGYDYDADTDAAESKEWLFKAPVASSGELAHLIARINVSGACRVRVYQDSQIGSDGTAITLRNKDLNEADYPTASFFRDPTNVTEGNTILFDEQVGAAGTAVIDKILKSGSDYVFRVTAQAANTLISMTATMIKHIVTQAAN